MTNNLTTAPPSDATRIEVQLKRGAAAVLEGVREQQFDVSLQNIHLGSSDSVDDWAAASQQRSEHHQSVLDVDSVVIRGVATNVKLPGWELGDVNEAATSVSLSGGSVSENAAGAVVGTLSTVDADAGDTHSYTVSDGRFEVVGSTLQLRDGVSLDHEAGSEVVVEVTSTDLGGLSRTESVTVEVGDVNEAATSVSLSGGSVSENAAGAVVGTLSTVDADAGDTHSYTVSDGRFEVVGSTLQLRDGVSLDHEAGSEVVVEVTSTDLGGLSRTESVTVEVGDVNEAATSVSLSGGSVSENAAGAVVGTLSTVDADAGDTHSYTVSDGRFEVVGSTLQLRDGVSLDHEAGSEVVVEVTSTDLGGLSRTESVTVEVGDVNEAATSVSLSGGSVSENAAGAVVGTLSTVDADAGDTHSYTVSDGRFEVVGSTLQLRDGVSLDHEAGSEVVVEVTSTDLGGLSRTESVTVEVGDVNEAATSVSLSGGSVSENAAGAVVGTLSTVDADAGDTHSYTVSDGRFEVVGSTLQLRDGVSLDHEAGSEVVVEVTSTDLGGLSRTESVTVEVGDVNEVATSVSLSGGSVSENAAGAVVGTLSTVDADAGDTHSYTVSDGRFEVVGSTLQLRDGVSLDHEAGSEVVVEVTSTDLGGLSRTESVTVEVGDVNEAATSVSLSGGSVSENAAGAVVGTLSTVDADAGDTHSYTVSDGRFEVVGSTLQLRDGVSLDHEAGSEVVVEVTSTDLGGLSRTESVTVEVGDVNEAATSVSLSGGSVSENAAGAVVGTLSTVDADAGDTHSYTVSDGRFEVVGSTLQLRDGVSLDHEAGSEVVVEVTSTDLGGLSRTESVTVEVGDVNEAATSVSLSGGSVSENAAGAVVGTLSTVDADAGDTHSYTVSDGRFEVVGSTLQLRDGVSLDHEAGSEVVVEVTSTDLGGLSRTESVTVEVGDVNEAATSVSLSGGSVSENAAGAVVGTLSTVDADAGDTHSYTVSDGRFEVVGSTLQLRDGVSLDHEAGSEVVVEVTSTDLGGLSRTESVTVEVGDVNEAATSVSLSGGSVSENAAGAVVGTLSTVDADAGDTHSYTVSDGRFEVVGSTLQLRDGVSLDHEAGSEVVVEVTSTDLGGLSRTESVTVEVGDVNEAATSVSLSGGSVSENAAGAVVGTLSTVDADAGDTHSYTVSDGRFEVVGSTLQLRDGVSLDHEAGSEVVVEVTSTDLGGLSRTESVTVEVGDVNEAATSVSLSGGSVSENAAGAVVGTLSTVDADAGDTHSYTVSDGRFEVVGSTLQLRDGVSLDHEAGSEVVVEVTSTDLGGLSRTESVTVEVGDVNEAATSVSLSGGSVSENAAGAVVGTLSTVDADAGDTHSYTVSDGRFEVVGSTLQLRDGVSLDHEAGSEVVVEVTSTDLGGLSRTESVTVEVGDVNEAATSVSLSGGSVSENAAGAVVGTLSTVDADAGDTHSYTVSDGRFEVVGSTLQLRDGVSLDHEAGSEVVVEVTSTDLGGLSRTESVTVEVGDVNEAATSVSLSGGSVSENAAGAVVGTLSTVDADAGDTHSYTVSDGRFEVVGSTLQLRDGVSLDHEAGSEVVVEVTSTDLGGLSRTESVTVEVGDVNEVATSVSLSGGSVSENAAGAVVGTLSTVDADAGDTHSYTVSDGRFEVVGSTLQLRDGVSLDHEAGSEVVVEVTSTDLGGLSRTESVTVEVGDVNEAATSVSLSGGSVSENAAGAVVGTLSTVDADAGDTHSYTVSDGRFEVVGSTLQLRDGVSLDHEAGSEVVVEVTSTDLGGLSRTESVTVEVGDVNEAATSVSLSGGSVSENAAGAVVGTLSTVDADAGDTHSYTVSDGRFEVVGSTLQLRDGVSLDHEAGSEVVVEVTSTDLGGLSRTESVTVEVGDVNEAATSVSLSGGSVSENAAGAVVGTLSTVDADAGDTHSYTVSDGRFEVVGSTLQLRDGVSLDHEAGSEVVVEVTSTDLGGLSRTESVTVEVGDVNEAATSVSLSGGSVSENAAGAVVGTLSTVDADAGDTHSYTVSDGRFEVVGSTLQLRDGVSLDHEAGSEVVVEVTSTDLGGLSRTESVTVEVGDVNEAATSVSLSGGSVSENAAGAVVGTLSTVDADAGDTHSYTVSDGRFEVVGSTLQLRESPFVVEAEDMVLSGYRTHTGSQASGGQLVRTNAFGGDGELSTEFEGFSGTYTVSVFAQDESDGQNELAVLVNGVEVSTIQLDRDTDGAGSNNGRFSEFVIEGVEINEGDDIQIVARGDGGGEGSRIDRIEFDPGEIMLDHEAEPEITVEVTATDLGGLSRTESFTIEVTDDGNVAASLDLNASELVAPGSQEIPTMEFAGAAVTNSGQSEVTDGAGQGESALWSDVGSFQGMAFDVRATIVSTTSNYAEFSTSGDNAAFWTQAGETEVRYEFLEAGTENSLIINGSFLIDDLDGGSAQEAFTIDINQVDVYGVEDGGDIVTSAPSDPELQFNGVGSTYGGDSTNAVAFNMSGTGGFTVTYSADAGTRAFYLDGDWSDGYFSNVVSTDTNDDHADVFTEGSGPVSVASSAINISDTDDTHLEGAVVTLTNAQANDQLVVGDLPEGISVEIDASVGGQITVTLSGSATMDDYEQALQQVAFENTSSEPAIVPREIQVTVDDGDKLSEPAVSTIYVNDLGSEGLERDTGSDTDADILVGNASDNTLSGLGGDDTLVGGAGDDTLIGGSGNDTLSGGDGDDLFTFGLGDGQNVVEGGAGWTDVISIEGLTGGSLGSDWTVTLDTGEITSQDADTVFLSEDASGQIEIQDGTRIDFNDVSQIQY